MSTLTFPERVAYPATTATYLHVRLVAAVGGPICAARSLRAAHGPAHLDCVKLAAMGVERPPLTRRLMLLPEPSNDPPDAA